VVDNRSGALAVIPARWASTRFPGKILADLAGHPLIEYVYRRTLRAKRVSRVLVATDDERILKAVRDFGGEAVMTREDHPSGTDRVAEVSFLHPEAEIILNVQGDEPLIHPGDIDAAAAPLLEDRPVDMTTVAVPIQRPEDFLDPNVVKVVVDGRGDALYFSRAPVPLVRDLMGSGQAASDRLGEGWSGIQPRPLKHLGLYAYRREYLLRLATIPPSPLEEAEKLEQLRVLEDGARIRVVQIEHDSIGVDVPEDLARLNEDPALRSQVEQEAGLWPSTSL
jgi:3-deoxy-manno-octulosonate cytidylyltransferase (CMP-KDO synthetase)